MSEFVNLSKKDARSPRRSVTISIVTAVLNRVDTVGRAIESLRAQDYRSVEHIIVDGVSTDGTLDVCRRMAADGTKILSEPDEGIYDAINKGIELATGDVIGVLHADDFLASEDVLSRVAEAFEDAAVDAVYGDLEYVSAHNPGRVIRTWRAGPFDLERLEWGWMPPHPTLYVRSQVVNRLGPYDTSYRIAADYDAVLRWFGSGQVNAVYLPYVMVRMKMGGASNGGVEQVIRKWVEDYRAIRANDIGGVATLLSKNVSKVGQFFRR